MENSKTPTPEELQQAMQHIRNAALLIQLDAMRVFEIAVQNDADNPMTAELANLIDDLDEPEYPYNKFKVPEKTEFGDVIEGSIAALRKDHIGRVLEWRRRQAMNQQIRRKHGLDNDNNNR